MPKESKATVSSVKGAISQLQEAGNKISVRNVHQIVRGDYNRVAALLKEAQEAEAALVQAPDDIVEMFSDWASELYTKVRVSAEEQFNASLELMKARVERVEADRDEAGEAITTLASEIESIQESTSTEIADLKSQMSTATQQRDLAAGQVAALNAQIATDADAHRLALSDLREALKADMKAQTDIEVEAQKSEITGLKTRFVSITVDLDAAKTKSAELSASQKIAMSELSLETKRADKAEVSLSKAQADAKASRVDVSELSDKVSELTKAVEALKENKKPKGKNNVE